MNEIWFVTVKVKLAEGIEGDLLLVQKAKSIPEAARLVRLGLDKIVREGVTFTVGEIGGVMDFANKLASAAGGLKG